MSVAVDAVGTAQTGASGTSANIPITIGSGANRCVVVSFSGDTNTTGIAATIGGQALSIISGTNASSTVMLARATTLTGAQTVAVSWTTSQRFITNAVSYTGANQDTIQANNFNGGVNSTGASPFTQSVTSTSGDLTVTRGGVDSTTNQTQDWSATQAGIGTLRVDHGPGTGTTGHTWTGSGTLRVVGLNIVKKSGGSRMMLMGLGR